MRHRQPADQAFDPTPDYSPVAGVVPTGTHRPHWEQEGRAYFVTYRTVEGFQLPPPARDVVLDNLRHWDGSRYFLYQALVMPDHVHILVAPLAKFAEASQDVAPMWRLQEILHTAKSYTAKVINRLLEREGRVWQEGRFDKIVRSAVEFEQRWEYIRNNPVEARLAPRPEEYGWLYEWRSEQETDT